MIYYREDGSKIEYNPKEEDFISSGRQGSVFKVDNDTCLKRYFLVDKSKLSIFDDASTIFTEEMFEILKNLNLQNYCELYELLYNSNDPKTREVIAYTMKYYEKLKISFLFLPTEYLIESYKKIYEGVTSLINAGIDIVDFNGTNIITTEEEMIAIDFDKWRKSYLSIDDRWYMNMDQLHYAFISMFERELKKTVYSKRMQDSEKQSINLEIRDIFMRSSNPYTLARRLKPYPKPIDIIYRR